MHEHLQKIIFFLRAQWRWLLPIVFLLGVTVVIGIAHRIILPYGEYIVPNIDDLPTRDIGLVFGGGMEADGSQSSMQAARVRAGVDLYKKGKVKKLLMTGDDGSVRFNEIDAMVYHARTLGVPVYDILTDPHAYRTYESCYREAQVYGVTSVIAISQQFHLPRIIYFCRHFGIDTIGFAADYQGYSIDDKMALREMLARVKGWWQVEVTKPVPPVTTP